MAKHKNGFFNAEIIQEEILWSDKKRIMFFGLPWTFTRYSLTETKLKVTSGFWRKIEDDIQLYRVSDVTLYRTVGERMNKIGTICVMSSDASSPETHLVHIKQPQKVKDLIMQKVEEARRKSGVYTSEIVGGGPRPPMAGQNPPDGGAHAAEA